MTGYAMGDEVLSGWRISRLIGEGAYGRVFEVEKTTYGFTARSALKVVSIPPSPSMVTSALSEGMSEREVEGYFGEIVEGFINEAALLSSLRHPGIVDYQDHEVVAHKGTIGWDVLLRMELLEPLPMRLVATGTMEQSEVVRLGIELADALAFCHEHDIVHRDVKPENIFADTTNRFKLGDFGVSRAMEGTAGALSRRGTESYMAPELYRGEAYGATVDVYALGLVLYRLLNANRLPFLPLAPASIGHVDRQQALERRLSGEPLPQPPGCSDELFAILLRASAYDSKDRLRAAELRDELQAYFKEVVKASSGVSARAVDSVHYSLRETISPFDGGMQASPVTRGSASTLGQGPCEGTVGIWGASATFESEPAAAVESVGEATVAMPDCVAADEPGLKLDSSAASNSDTEQPAPLISNINVDEMRDEDARTKRAEMRKSLISSDPNREKVIMAASFAVGLLLAVLFGYFSSADYYNGSMHVDSATFLPYTLIFAAALGLGVGIYFFVLTIRWLVKPSPDEQPRWVPGAGAAISVGAGIAFFAANFPNDYPSMSNISMIASISLLHILLLAPAFSGIIRAIWSRRSLGKVAEAVIPLWHICWAVSLAVILDCLLAFVNQFGNYAILITFCVLLLANGGLVMLFHKRS